MELSAIVAISGIFITFSMSINAFFLKGIARDMNTIKIEMAKLSTEHNLMTEMVRKHDSELDKLKERLHSIEGMVPSIIEFIKDRGK